MAIDVTIGSVPLHWAQLIEHELLLFAAFWFVVGIIDEVTIDLTWLWLRLTGRIPTHRIPASKSSEPLAGPLAVFVPAWLEAAVIAKTMRHALVAWPQRELRLYIGCYRNDPLTLAAAVAGAGSDSRVRLVIHDRGGPSTKADCLNRLYNAMCADEARSGAPFRGVIFHDAEDMVHPAALALIDRALDEVDFVQLPVRPEPQAGSRWIAGHYADEFAESHAKALVVRDAVGAAIPAAGVGCGFARSALAELATRRIAAGEAGPFAAECLTEDYELGLTIARAGRRSRFLRLRDHEGALIATRSYFPPTLPEAVRQKTRWIHGIAFQSWDRLGWSGRVIDVWMALRDRRGPLTALVLFAAYLLLVIDGVLLGLSLAGWYDPPTVSPLLRALLMISFAGLLWRMLARFAFTTREYGWAEGLRSALRIPIGNIIAIMAARRALVAYFKSLRGEPIRWDKTAHDSHPADLLPQRAAA